MNYDYLIYDKQNIRVDIRQAYTQKLHGMCKWMEGTVYREEKSKGKGEDLQHMEDYLPNEYWTIYDEIESRGEIHTPFNWNE